MKAPLLGLLAFTILSVHAQVTGVGVQTEYAASLAGGESIQGFGLASNGDIYFTYGTFFPSQSLGVDVWNGVTQTNLYSSGPGVDYPGGATVHQSTAGEFMYFLRDNFPTPGFNRVQTGSTSVSNQTTVSPASSFTGAGDRMFVSGFGSDSGLYVGDINGDGSVSALTEITSGGLTGSSGPIAFDAAGNMYFAPGFSDKSIYKWTASEVTAAIADPVANGLTESGNQWLDYSGDSRFDSVDGISGLAIDGDGNLFASVTSFTNPSLLARFSVNGSGDYQVTSLLASSTGRLNSVRINAFDNRVYFADTTTFYSIPEPGTLVMMGISVVVVGGLFLRRTHA